MTKSFWGPELENRFLRKKNTKELGKDPLNFQSSGLDTGGFIKIKKSKPGQMLSSRSDVFQQRVCEVEKAYERDSIWGRNKRTGRGEGTHRSISETLETKKNSRLRCGHRGDEHLPKEENKGGGSKAITWLWEPLSLSRRPKKKKRPKYLPQPEKTQSRQTATSKKMPK